MSTRSSSRSTSCSAPSASAREFPAPELSGYPRETVVAEKFQAMVYLRTLNSRTKDFNDVWLLG